VRATVHTANLKKSNSDKVDHAAVIVAACMVLMGSSAVWSFSERIGLSSGMSAKEVTFAISVTAIAGIAGAVAAVWAARFKRNHLMAFAGAAMFGTSVSLFAISTSPMFYISSLTVLSFAFLFVTPFITAIAIEADSSGNLWSAAHGSQILVGSFGPLIGGFLLSRGSFATLAVVTATTSLLTLVAICISGRNAERQRGAKWAGEIAPSVQTPGDLHQM
jgi:predicted MFS family arabinose efflux permease